jgi:hypothetical protein
MPTFSSTANSMLAELRARLRCDHLSKQQRGWVIISSSFRLYVKCEVEGHIAKAYPKEVCWLTAVCIGVRARLPSSATVRQDDSKHIQ